MKKGSYHGPKAGDRDIIMRLRVSEDERQHLHEVCSAQGVTVALAMREALRKSGLLPKDSASGQTV